MIAKLLVPCLVLASIVSAASGCSSENAKAPVRVGTVDVYITTGDDDLRTDSSAGVQLLFDDRNEQNLGVKSDGDTALGNGSVFHQQYVIYDQRPIIRAMVYMQSHDDELLESDDQWLLARVAIVRTLDGEAPTCVIDRSGPGVGTGVAIDSDPKGCTFLGSEGASDGSGGTEPLEANGPPAGVFTLTIETGGDDLRYDSTATATIVFDDLQHQTIALKTATDPGFANDSARTFQIVLHDAAPIRDVTFSLGDHPEGFETGDAWDIARVQGSFTDGVSFSPPTCVFDRPGFSIDGSANVTVSPGGCPRILHLGE